MRTCTFISVFPWLFPCIALSSLDWTQDRQWYDNWGQPRWKDSKILPAPLAHEGKVFLQPLAAAPLPPGFSPFSALPLALPLLFLSSVFLPFDLPTSFNILNTAGQTACQATGNSRSAPDGQSRPVNKRKFCMSRTCLVKWTKLLCHRRVSVNAQIRQAILKI